MYVTFAGIDGNPCGCWVFFGSQQYTDLTGVDGKWTLNFVSEAVDPVSGYTICTYTTGTYRNIGTSVVFRRYINTDCTNEWSTLNFTSAIIILEIYKESGKVRRLRFGTNIGNGNSYFFVAGDPYTSIPPATGGRGAIIAYPGADFDVAINNYGICGQQISLIGAEFPVSASGTAVVSLT